MLPPQPPQDATDIFSISDQVLADRLHFIEEIGFGNWGSVWLCRPKPDPSSSSGLPDAANDSRIAVKLVHRSKTSTTAARVRSLWNEMKVVRSLKHEPHPSIIPFYSFIITPSYALITMAYHPKLVPVEVAEYHAKDWFHSLLSGVEYLHKHGVVHNDIKPANILLSSENVPVLVDFGFAEQYDMSISTAFHSNLSYGTPEYLSPERARGLQHDTRKSDVWSLGVTFFEILVGRTPFEYAEGEQFSSKEDLEKYWARTMKGKWVGEWKMSKPIETLLKRMMAPNADVRCTAKDAMADPYWAIDISPPRSHAHKKSASVSQVLSPSLTANLNTDVSKILDTLPPWSTTLNVILDDAESQPQAHPKAHKRTKSKIPVMVDKENGSVIPPGLVKEKGKHTRSQSQPKLPLFESSKGTSQTRKPIILPSLLSTLSPIKHTPPTITSVSPPNGLDVSEENLSASLSQAVSDSTSHTRGTSFHSKPTRKPLGPRRPTPPSSPHGTPTTKEMLSFLSFSSSSNTEDLSSSLRIGTEGAGGKEKSDTVRSQDSSRRRDKVRGEEKEKGKDSMSKKRRSHVFSDFTSTARNIDLSAHTLPPVPRKEKREKSARIREINLSRPPSIDKENSTPSPIQALVMKPAAVMVEEKKGSVRDRMREWERERERLREMQRLEERMREAEEERNEQAEREREEEEQLQEEIEAQQALQLVFKLQEDDRKKMEDEMEKERETERIRASERPSGIPRPVVQAPAGAFHFTPEEKDLPITPATPGPDGYVGPTALSPVLEVSEPSFESRFLDSYPRSGNESGLSVLKQSLNKALDKSARLYKTSTLALNRSTNALDVSRSSSMSPDNSRQSINASESLRESSTWYDEPSHGSKSSLPLAQQVAKTEKIAADKQLDRLSLWIKSVEKVVEDARQNFAAAAPATLPPLPVAPSSRSSRQPSTPTDLNTSQQRSNRAPRRILPANQIFVDEYQSGEISPGLTTDYFSSAPGSAAINGTFAIDQTIPTIPSEVNSPAPPSREAPFTPVRTRTRSATVITRSPEVKKTEKPILEIDTSGTPSNRREKSKSQNDLSRAITPVAELELQIERLASGITEPAPTKRLSSIVDKKVFVPDRSVTNLGITETPERKRKHDELVESPLQVDPYPPRSKSTNLELALDTPAKKHIEGVYDRFLMSTTGVRRVGKGYQSDAGGPIGNIAPPKPAPKHKKENFFLSKRKPLPPPVSSEDLQMSASVDEFGNLCSSPAVVHPTGKVDHTNHGNSIVRRALRTIVNGKR